MLIIFILKTILTTGVLSITLNMKLFLTSSLLSLFREIDYTHTTCSCWRVNENFHLQSMLTWSRIPRLLIIDTLHYLTSPFKKFHPWWVPFLWKFHFSRKLEGILGGGVKLIGISTMNHIAAWLFCFIIMGNYHSNVFMHNTLPDNDFITKYCVNTQYVQHPWKMPKCVILDNF